MTEAEESAYILGERAVWRRLLGECLRNLGYDDTESGKVAWVCQREDIVAQLRMLCEAFGDNEWEPTDHLGDVIDKHLGRWLHDQDGRLRALANAWGQEGDDLSVDHAKALLSILPEWEEDED